MGYQNLQQRQEYSANSLHVFAGIDISETFFNVGASEEFSKTHSKYSESIALTFDMGVRGGPPLNGTYATPIEMGTAFTNWKQGLIENPELAAGLRMVWRNWYDIAEVQNIVNLKGNVTIIGYMTASPPPTTIYEEMTKAYTQYQQIMRSVEQTLRWDCAQSNATYRSLLNDLHDQLNSRLTAMYYYQEAKLSEIAADVRAGNFSWFINHNNVLNQNLDEWQHTYCKYNSKYYTAYPTPSSKVLGTKNVPDYCQFGQGTKVETLLEATMMLN